VISATSHVALILVSDLLEAVREEALDEGLLELSPSVKGSYSWINSRTLEFVPDEMLDP
jgi:hypothetical protein